MISLPFETKPDFYLEHNRQGLGMQKFLLDYPFVVKRIIAWALKKEQWVQKYGKPLSKKYLSVARFMGVQHPEKIRLVHCSEKEGIVDDPKIAALLEKFDLDIHRISALALHHGIVMNASLKGNEKILAHELRHVAQYEICGSTEVFLLYYFLEVAHFGYGKGPFEIDAEMNAQIYMQRKKNAKKPNLSPPPN